MPILSKEVKKVFVMGASGFIGCRLVEKLFYHQGHTARCLIRDPGKLSRLARFPVDIINGDVLDREGIGDKAADCDVYVFSVHGKDMDPARSWQVNIDGLRNMLDMAVENGVHQFIFLSTTAVYEEQFTGGDLDESTVPVCTGKDYAHAKLEGEKMCLEYASKHGLQVSILRPTIVYGPFAPSFTIQPVQLIKSGALRDYGFFTGLCNPIYVDDVVDAIITCMYHEPSYGEIFNLSSGETMTWKGFFDQYSIALTGQPLPTDSKTGYFIKALPLRVLKNTLKTGVQLAPDFAKKVYSYIKSKGSGDWSWVKGEDVSAIRHRNYRKKLVFKVDRLRDQLGYQPAYPLKRGMALTRDWLSHHRYISRI